MVAATNLCMGPKYTMCFNHDSSTKPQQSGDVIFTLRTFSLAN